MKLLLPLISLLIASAALAEEPAELVELRQAWEKERTEAQAKIDKLYFEELEQLKKNFTQASNITDALAVDNVIKGGDKADNEPVELTKVRLARDKSLKKVSKPLDKRYWQDLLLLKDEFVKAGNLAGVVSADAEINKVLAAYKKSPEPKKNATLADAPDGSDTFKVFKMEFVVIGNPNNKADDTGYGAVPYTYRIGKYEVSEAMIDAYNKHSGMPTISMDSRGPNKPATNVSWYEAARFVNWLNISQGHQPAYKFGIKHLHGHLQTWHKGVAWQLGGENLYRHKDAKYFLPSENEWYKAAYYDQDKNRRRGGKGDYWDYATGSDKTPEPVASGTDVGTAVHGIYSELADTTNAGGLSPSGTMAQNGNVWETLESASDGLNNEAIEPRVRRGSWANDSRFLVSSSRWTEDPPSHESFANGFRVASVAE